jgi:CheY-like chemotaxis protein
LINDILDLSKIESGTTTVEASDVTFTELRESIERTFRAVADETRLAFTIELDPSLPPSMVTDVTRLHQVLKNLLSNAFKFTEQGSVGLRIGVARSGWRLDHPTLNRAHTAVSFAVSDTGIGIPADKQAIIFEAFQQADMATSRKFGGTGLGLAISREIAHLLGGELTVASQPDEGSTFTLYLPLIYQPTPTPGSMEELVLAHGGRGATPVAPPEGADGGRPPLLAGEVSGSLRDSSGGTQDRVLLILEEDSDVARLLRTRAQEHGFKPVVAIDPEMALTLAHRLRPDAIILDVHPPSTTGWWVLDHLKHDPRTRHIPVHVIAAADGRQRALALGAVAHLQKPVSAGALDATLEGIAEFVERTPKNLLVVEGDDAQRRTIVEVIGNGDVQVTAVSSGAEALAALTTTTFDCIVLDLGLPDMSGFEVIHTMKAQMEHPQMPIVVSTARDLTPKEEAELRRLAEALTIKEAPSPEWLLDATALFLHRVEATLSESQRGMLQQVRRTDPVLEGKKVLIVDDDMRNIFALTSALERYKMDVAFAENGQAGIDVLTSRLDIDVVLMDIMLPEMDGFETIRRIRAVPRHKALPIIALTAKAMSGDREKCLDAGASDYISKPVDVSRLLSLLRVWLSHQR